MHTKTLILSYGNVDRQDDGVAWHVLKQVATLLHLPPPEDAGKGFWEASENVDFIFQLQLTPELAETVALYDQVVFIDAHTGNVPQEIHLEAVDPVFTTSPFTHHMTAAACMYLVSSLYRAKTQAILVSIRGYEFGFSEELSPRTAALVQPAAEKIIDWLNH